MPILTRSLSRLGPRGPPHKALLIPEIVENILLYVALPMDFWRTYGIIYYGDEFNNLLQIHLCRRVCHLWKNVIDWSPIIRKLTWKDKKLGSAHDLPIICYPAISWMIKRMKHLNQLYKCDDFLGLHELLRKEKFPKIFISAPAVPELLLRFCPDVAYDREFDDLDPETNHKLVTEYFMMGANRPHEFLLFNPKGVTVEDVVERIAAISRRYYKKKKDYTIGEFELSFVIPWTYNRLLDTAFVVLDYPLEQFEWHENSAWKRTLPRSETESG
ncbi:hypothetical protein ABW19_dt0203222 [Dactylella cylindrospora]|nr:hypothetical protein ABW19_dt0203222 [Dactylella cylindrospora]